jgi:hypothetical protein
MTHFDEQLSGIQLQIEAVEVNLKECSDLEKGIQLQSEAVEVELKECPDLEK